MVATLLLDRNKPFVSTELRQMVEAGWLPQITAIGAGRELTPEELTIALTLSGVDMVKGTERLRAAIAKYKAAHPEQS